MKVLLCMVLLAVGTNATLLNLLGARGGLGGGNGGGIGHGGGGPGGYGRGGYSRGGYGGGPGGGNNEIRHVRILTPIPIVHVGQGGGGGGGGIEHGRNLHGNFGGGIGGGGIGGGGIVGGGIVGGGIVGGGIGGGHANEVIIVRLIHENVGPGPGGQTISGSASGALIHGANAGSAISGSSGASLIHGQEERIVRLIHENAPGPSQEYASSITLHQHSHHGAPQEERVLRIIHEHAPASHHSATASSGGIHSNAGGQEEVVRIIHEDADSSTAHLSSSASSDLLTPLPNAQSHKQYLPPHSHHHGHYDRY